MKLKIFVHLEIGSGLKYVLDNYAKINEFVNIYSFNSFDMQNRQQINFQFRMNCPDGKHAEKKLKTIFVVRTCF